MMKIKFSNFSILFYCSFKLLICYYLIMYDTFGEKEEKELHEMRRRFGKLRFETDHNIEKSKLMNTYIE